MHESTPDIPQPSTTLPGFEILFFFHFKTKSYENCMIYTWNIEESACKWGTQLRWREYGDMKNTKNAKCNIPQTRFVKKSLKTMFPSLKKASSLVVKSDFIDHVAYRVVKRDDLLWARSFKIFRLHLDASILSHNHCPMQKYRFLVHPFSSIHL